MTTQNGVVDEEAARKALESIKESPPRPIVPQAVNLDEVTIEIIPVKVRYYKEESVLDDDGEPFINPATGEPCTYRVPKLRTARIQNLVPTDAYHHAMKLKDQGLSEAEGMAIMEDLVMQVWQISEPWMTRQMLIGEGIDLPVVTELFTRFFEHVNRPLNVSPLPGDSTTQDGGEEAPAS